MEITIELAKNANVEEDQNQEGRNGIDQSKGRISIEEGKLGGSNKF